jgi:hypothetical protein
VQSSCGVAQTRPLVERRWARRRVSIYLSTRTLANDTWATPQGVAINTTANDYSPVLSQDRLTLWFDSDRNSNSDLYVATRGSVGDAFGSTMAIDELNTSGAESDFWVSRDQRRLIFVRDGVMFESVR